MSDMRIAVVRNRFWHPEWTTIDWINSVAQYDSKRHSFLVYEGPDVETRFHPETLVKFKDRELVGLCVHVASIHDVWPTFPAPLGYPKFRDDFFVVKNGLYAEHFIANWLMTGNVSEIVFTMGVPPVDYPQDAFTFHMPLHACPQIIWGDPQGAPRC